ncbi:putative receptor protein kinase ZmPK1 [Juglans microcarpa x Juglans regia]|uniref:putative receptor protein kinase ZmPK1 n=1 Tax=Juglans microcarpa x Juglans regia TaxID=2249226 RepID=UPI001B7D9EEE|nr:putative receptor protein kinase ZmPK1 [Juglans microcarpa x Juglans regia]
MKFMGTLILFILFSALFAPATSTNRTLSEGLSLSSENPEDVLTSPKGVFSAGFYPVGDNAYCFAIWFASRTSRSQDRTVVWMANRDQPVNGRKSKLSLLRNGNLILTDAGKFTVWQTNTVSISSLELHLYDTGNLVLRTSGGESLWESFDFPTDTLLPQQLLTRNTKLVSSRSQTNYSSGFYKLLFDNDNVLCLLYDRANISSPYWPAPWLTREQANRFVYNSSRIAVLDSFGNFSSSDKVTVSSTDYGQLLHRRLTLDYDGNLRLYSWDEEGEMWVVSWQAWQIPCIIHGVCGPNSICSYVPDIGRKCSCLRGYKMINHSDWSQGCEPEFDLSFGKNKFDFLQISHLDFYGFDYGSYHNYTLAECKQLCLELPECKAFQYTFSREDTHSSCYPKTLLMNGHRLPSSDGSIYLRVPKTSLPNLLSNANFAGNIGLNCSNEGPLLLERVYLKNQVNGTVKFMLWFVCGLGGLEIVGIFLVWCILIRTPKSSRADKQGYLFAITGFRKFTYSELKKATKGFTEEIGRGAGGIVYKGVLADNRVAAIKQLYEANQGEEVFLAEVNIIGRLNHMNLIEMWGYCAEGKQRLLVSEYMEHGSLADNLSSNSLDWKKRFEIALGTAKGLSYLHEECLEWVLHCDVKPENIFLDSNYQPKVADFGLSKLQSRGDANNPNFSRMRGTRGYMAPEWVFNLPITSKVDVYSYGIVVLEMVTGKDAAKGVHDTDGGEQPQHKRLVSWVREKKNRAALTESWLEEIIDPSLKGKYDVRKMETLIGVALQCAEEEKDARPSMREVVEMLLDQENDR